MSFFSGKKSKDKDKHKEVKEKDLGGKKSQFYVEFLGWMECRGVRGRRYTDPVIQELKRRQKKMDNPPKLTIQLTAKDLKISQDFEEKRKRGIKKITFPAIPARDVTYAVQATRPSDNKLDDVVACIYLGYMPRTGRCVHVHVYRFDEPSTAATFAKLMNGIVADNLNRINDVERDLAEKGEIDDPGINFSDGMSEHATTGTDSAAGSVSGSAYSENGSPTFGSDDMDADLQSLNDVQPFDSVAEELKHRLRMGDGPLLLPPKDYDTISRARGNLMEINQRRCLNVNVVGEGVGDQRPRNGSEESGIDLASPSSENGDVISSFPPAPAPAPAPASPALARGSRSAHGSGNTSPVVGAVENGFVYPPKQERHPRSGSMSPALHHHVRQSSQSSPFSTQSSRASRHSNNSGENRFPPYSRSNSSNSNNNPPVHVVGPLQDEEYVPPTDYDDDSYNEPVVMRRNPYLASFDRPASASPMGSPMLMRSLPANILQSEMALHSPRSAGRAEGGDEYFFNAQRRSQPVYASHNVLDMRPQAADYGGHHPRRVNSTNR